MFIYVYKFDTNLSPYEAAIMQGSPDQSQRGADYRLHHCRVVQINPRDELISRHITAGESRSFSERS